jgi:shikimate dehydrogenase
MHNGVIARRRLPLRYIGIDLPRGLLPDWLRIVRAGNFLGGNVTIPYKEEAAALADERTDEVAFCGAANVLVVRDARLLAGNTDGPGFLDAVKGAGWGEAFRRVVLLGAGGAARGIAFELGRAGTGEMAVLNRNPDRAERFVRDLSPRFPRMALSAGELSPPVMRRELPGADLIVQCTSLGLSEEWTDFPLEAVQKASRFADIVYRKGGTLLVRRLRRRGVSALDGLPMLAHQAARSFTLWTGTVVPGEEFLACARKALALSRPRPGPP